MYKFDTKVQNLRIVNGISQWFRVLELAISNISSCSLNQKYQRYTYHFNRAYCT